MLNLGFRLTNEKAIKAAKEWRRVDNGGVVSVVDAFTCRSFGDSSLIFVTNYHPLSKTLVEAHFSNTNRYGSRANSNNIPEHVLWSYTVQLANAIKSVHSANLAVRCMEPSKILVTDKARIRLGACAVLDVVQFEQNRLLVDLQQEDFILFGKLLLALATNNLTVTTAQNLKPAMDQLTRNYSVEFRDTVAWLLTPAQAPAAKSIDEFIMGISSHVITQFDTSLHANDTMNSSLNREIENGRIARLMMKLGTINERPEFDGDKDWSEVGERYCLKLFRDYVFHQVDAQGKPVVDIAHILRCLNKLDAGTDEKIMLVTRDEQGAMIYSYKELNKLVNKSFNELTKTGSGKNRY
jgi:PAB-dependent poly(A)-specific ribonuclease subunit 3